MEWVLKSPQIHSTFGNLGFKHGDRYHINKNCNAALETILHNILTEDKYLRTYRRSISFGQNIEKDLIPLLINTKEDDTIELLIKILVNLTIPIECLLSVETLSKSEFGRHAIFEINNLLTTTKAAFTDERATKFIIDFLKKNVDYEQNSKLSSEHCTNISNCLLLLRNILHIPEDTSGQSPTHAVQNQILWNIFSQSIDKLLIKLSISPDANKYAVTMVQLIALLYKDQHVATLHKLLNLWLETSLYDSSEDNESNTSPLDIDVRSDPTSDSSDTGASGNCNDESNAVNKDWVSPFDKINSNENSDQPYELPKEKIVNSKQNNKIDSSISTNEGKIQSSNNCNSGIQSEATSEQPAFTSGSTDKKPVIAEISDYGYDTQIENQESTSTSSNEDELPAKKPVHQKPHNPKQKTNKARAVVTIQDRKRKKILKRVKAHIINVQGLSHKTPTDEDISNILKEFTVDFLLKGYNSLAHTLHNQILTNLQLEIDTSHFFWLVTYFLKFATHIELDVKHVSSVLSFDIVSYLTAEGVNLCEQFELSIKLDGNDLKPILRRLHLDNLLSAMPAKRKFSTHYKNVKAKRSRNKITENEENLQAETPSNTATRCIEVVTAIREIIQALEVYKQISHVCKEDKEILTNIQIKMCDTEELRSLLVLLLRHYNPTYHSKQYLQDLVVTNHILLIFLDTVTKLPEYAGTTKILDHIQQFATSDIMYQYGLLLEDYATNGEFVNDCIFTLMHHVGGELDSLISLFQPKILKAFTSIWKSEFEICDDWSDLIEYVINTFIKKPHSLQSTSTFRLDTENFDDDKGHPKMGSPRLQKKLDDTENKVGSSNLSNIFKEKWTDEELTSLCWNYMQCSNQDDVVGEIVKLFKDDGIIKTRDSVIQELFKQNTINKDEYEKLVKRETATTSAIKKLRDDEIGQLCEQLIQDDKLNILEWVQKVLLDTCFAKIFIEKVSVESKHDDPEDKTKQKGLSPKTSEELHLHSPVSYHSIVFKQSIPLVPWNCKQALICKDLRFLQLLHKLGFYMPVDSGNIFIRIPQLWTADCLYDVAGKILPIDKNELKFSINDISDTNSKLQDSLILLADLTNDITMIESSENFYQIHKHKHLASLMNYMPMQGSSFTSETAHAHINQKKWFDIVQKSQEFKIPLTLGSKIVEEDKHPPSGPTLMRPPLVEMKGPPSPNIVPLMPSKSLDDARAAFSSAMIMRPTSMNLKQGRPL